MNPAALSHQLRRGHGRHLEERRGIVCASLVALGTMGLISLYQMGVIKHLPDPGLPGFDADGVDASDEAYAHLQMGDAFLGIGNYAVTLGLAAVGGKNRAINQPWIPLALAAKTAVDAASAAKLTYDQIAKHRAACIWCLAAAAATVVSAVLAIPEARTAVQHLSRKKP